MNDISPITEGDLIINTLDTLAELPVVDTKSSPISPEAEEVGAVQVGEGTVAGVESVVL